MARSRHAPFLIKKTMFSSGHEKMTMARALPWAVALHVLFLGALLGAAGGGVFSSGGASGRRLVIVSLGRDISQMAALNKTNNETNKTNGANASRLEVPKTADLPKAAIAPLPARTTVKTQPDVKTKTEAKTDTGAQPRTIAATQQTGAFQANPSAPALPFAAAQMFPRPQPRRMPPPVVMVWNPWLAGAILAGKKAAFLASAQKALQKMITDKVGEVGIRAYDGDEAAVAISYGPDGSLTDAKVTQYSGAASPTGDSVIPSGSGGLAAPAGLAALLKDVDWSSVPLPSACGLSLKSVALRIKVEKGTVSMALRGAAD